MHREKKVAGAWIPKHLCLAPLNWLLPNLTINIELTEQFLIVGGVGI